MKTILLVLLLRLTASAHAQLYRWVDDQGSVHYTDYPPPPNAKKVEEKKFTDNVVQTDKFPYSVQQAIKNYPVTLFTGDCGEVCTLAKAYLVKRGIPFSERQVQTPEDNDALERLSGGRDAPTLSIGAQILRGLSSEIWGSYLDAAGYPRESQLPANYQYPAAAPVVARAPAPRAPEPASTETPAAAPRAANPSGIKY